MPKELESGAVRHLEAEIRNKDLETENEALRKRNQHLESMMQMARAEVQRMDAAAAGHHHRRHGNCGTEIDILKQEILDLQNKLRQSDSDKNDLVESLRHMLQKNATKNFEREAVERANRAESLKMALEVKCGKERQALEAQLQAAGGQCDDTKEVAKNLQEENADLKKKLADASAEMALTSKTNKELSTDKVQLVTTMQGLMRENSRFKHGLQKVTEQEEKEASDLVATKAQLAKLAKIAKKALTPEKKPAKAMLKVGAHMHHEHLTDAQRAHMKEIDKYIDSADPASKDAPFFSDQQMGLIKKQDELIKKGKVGVRLSDWLGIKPPAPKPPAPSAAAKATPNKKVAADDDGEAEAEDLVKQASDQLAAMERDDDEK